MVRYYHPAESVWGSDITEPPSVSPREVEVEKPTPKSGHARRVSFSLSGHEAALRDLDRSHWQLQPTRHDPRPTSNFTRTIFALPIIMSTAAWVSLKDRLYVEMCKLCVPVRLLWHDMGNANLHINMTTLGKYAGCFENAIANYLLEIYASIGVTVIRIQTFEVDL